MDREDSTAPGSAERALPATPGGSSLPRPNALRAWRQIQQRLAGRRLALFLDYDGTLTPIAGRPKDALLSASMRAALEAVALVWPTSIVSGRARQDVERLVGLRNLQYAGSHGFDVSGKGGVHLEVAADAIPLLQGAAAELRERTGSIPGAVVEEKRFSVALHYRQVAHSALSAVEAAVAGVLASRPGLVRTGGKMVIELRPAVAWDKGAAVVWLLAQLEDPDAVPVYIGDDETDEDALRVVAGRGIGVLVSEVPYADWAEYVLQDVSEVELLLLRLAGLRGGQEALGFHPGP